MAISEKTDYAIGTVAEKSLDRLLSTRPWIQTQPDPLRATWKVNIFSPKY